VALGQLYNQFIYSHRAHHLESLYVRAIRRSVMDSTSLAVLPATQASLQRSSFAVKSTASLVRVSSCKCSRSAPLPNDYLSPVQYMAPELTGTFSLSHRYTGSLTRSVAEKGYSPWNSKKPLRRCPTACVGTT